jgi:hypothetical protein
MAAAKVSSSGDPCSQARSAMLHGNATYRIQNYVSDQIEKVGFALNANILFFRSDPNGLQLTYNV